MSAATPAMPDPETDELMAVLLDECEEHWRETLIVEHARWSAQPHRGHRPTAPAAGRTRIAFPSACGTHWRKVPLSDAGCLANAREADRSEAYESGAGGIPMARCHMDGAVLVMEHVEPVVGGHGAPDLPEWVGMVDCGQVGHDRAGRLVAYDL